MGTPASVVSDPPGRAAPAARGRKRASANIFQGVGLPELRSLFRSGGAERPEERARLVWRYAGQRRMARVLRRLRRRPEPMLALPCSHHTSHPCSRRAPLALPLPQQPPATQGGPRHRQGWHHAGCTAARKLAGSRGKSQARAAVETWQEGWTRAAEGERVLAPTLSPLQLGGAPTARGAALSYSPSQSHLLFTRTSQHLFPLSV
uniref:Arginine vasopressin-induced protein 1 n=1 Tax=Accipiter nisus TaxID=211598 RepID=A0A8B9MPL2_9AVES